MELSTIDTALLKAGILFCKSYFDGNNVTEKAIRDLAGELFRRVQWDWGGNGKDILCMGWHPESSMSR